MINDSVTDMITANLALLPLPAPNSFATRTLPKKVYHIYKVVIYIYNAWPDNQ